MHRSRRNRCSRFIQCRRASPVNLIVRSQVSRRLTSRRERRRAQAMPVWHKPSTGCVGDEEKALRSRLSRRGANADLMASAEPRRSAMSVDASKWARESGLVASSSPRPRREVGRVSVRPRWTRRAVRWLQENGYSAVRDEQTWSGEAARGDRRTKHTGVLRTEGVAGMASGVVANNGRHNALRPN